MDDTRFQEIERLIEDSGRFFDRVTGSFEPMDDAGEPDAIDSAFDAESFLAALGITQDECAEYVQRKSRALDE